MTSLLPVISGVVKAVNHEAHHICVLNTAALHCHKKCHLHILQHVTAHIMQS